MTLYLLFIVFATLTVLVTPVILVLSKNAEQAILLLASWPIALPFLLARHVKGMVKESRHQQQLEERRRATEAWESLLEDERRVDKYLE